mmetsp:Transcript_3332/g.9192  ORF Transcript_3332/g.9192 Transcript_3332/m.9192 type:complete len:185 (-) Transcript_3332:839-1393(-)
MRLADAVSVLGARLAELLPTGALLSAPSLQLAPGQLGVGASGETRDELGRAPWESCSLTSSTVSVLALQSGFFVEDALARAFGSVVAPLISADDVNRVVCKATDGDFDRIVIEQDVSSGTTPVAVSALCFRASWRFSFDGLLTREAPSTQDVEAPGHQCHLMQSSNMLCSHAEDTDGSQYVLIL